MLEKRIRIAKGEIKASLVLKNCQILNVFTEEIIKADIAIEDGIIAAIGEYDGIEEVDINNNFVSPGLIDSHIHLESTMATPFELSKISVPRGTTTVICDPHEIANVCGLDGINYILKASENAPMNVFVMLPSCVPATPFENSGAVLGVEELKKLIDNEQVLGLGELMDYVGVINADKNILDKIKIAENKNKDGHCPNVSGKELNAYIAAGITTDHECSTEKEMLERLRLGMYVQIREGSAAKNLAALIKSVTRQNLSRIVFCTDDRHPEEIFEYGHIDNNVRTAIKHGIEPLMAIKMATINAAQCYGLKNIGAVAPNYKADILIIDNLENFKIKEVYKDGKKVSEGSTPLFENKNPYTDEKVLNTVRFGKIEEKDIQIKMSSKLAYTIEILPHNLVTKKSLCNAEIENGYFKFTENSDILKIAVIERHKNTGNIGIALIKGFGLKNGAIASTIAHDSHNLIVVGDNDRDILLAIEQLRNTGGITVCINGEVKETLPLPIGGIISDKPIEYIKQKLDSMKEIAYQNGVSKETDPFMTLSFMALPVIPSLKITDKGLFDVDNFEFVDLCIE